MPKNDFPTDVVVCVQAKCLMDDKLTKDWILKDRMETVTWITQEITASPTMKNQDTTLSIIPGGITSLLQPLDVGINQPGKLRQKWNNWMLERPHTSHHQDFAGNPLYKYLPMDSGCLDFTGSQLHHQVFQEVLHLKCNGWYRKQ